MTAEALIHFTTDIKKVVEEVKSGLASLQNVGGGAKLSQKQLDVINPLAARHLREASNQLDRLYAVARKRPAELGETITGGAQRIVANTRDRLAADFAKNKIPIDLLPHIDDRILAPLTDRIKKQTAASVASGVDKGLLGATELRFRGSLEKVYNTPQAKRAQAGQRPTPPTQLVADIDIRAESAANRRALKAATSRATRADAAAKAQDASTKALQESAEADQRTAKASKNRAKKAEVADAAAGGAGKPPLNIRRLGQPGGPSGPSGDAGGTGPANRAIIPKTPEQRQGDLETRAEREMNTAAERRQTRAQRQGQLEERAEREMNTAAQRRQTEARRAGELETRAEREMETDLSRRQARARRQGQLEERAGREMETDLSRRQLKTFREEARAQALTRARVNQVQEKANLDRLFPEGIGKKISDSFREVAKDTYKNITPGSQEVLKLRGAGAVSLAPGMQGYPTAARQVYRARDKGFLGGVAEGLFGNQDYESRSAESLGKSAAITAKYASLAAVFYGLQGAIGQAGQELLDFEDSYADLTIAMRDSITDAGPTGFFGKLFGGGTGPDQSFINDLSESASRAGANVGQSMDLAASAMRAFRDETDGTEQAMQDMGARFAAEASKIATITTTTIADAGANLKAITLGFDIPTENFSRITDALAGARALGGGDETQVGQFLANISVAAKEAGFSLEEVGTIGSRVIAETDQGGQLVANRLSRLFSMIGSGAGKTAIQQLNQSLQPGQQIDTGASIRDQVVQLSNVYKSLGEAQRQQFINALGGTANARELIILLQQANTLVTQVADTSWAGKGAEQYALNLNNMRGILQQITGDLRNIVSTLAQSGILDPFLALVKFGLLPALDATRHLLETFNLIPRPLRSIALGLLGIYATMRLIDRLKGSDAFKNAIPQGLRGGLRGATDAAGSALGIVPRGDTDVRAIKTAMADGGRAAGRSIGDSMKSAGGWVTRGLKDIKGDYKALYAQSGGGIAGGLNAAGGLALGGVTATGRNTRAGLSRARTGFNNVAGSEFGTLGVALGGASVVNETFQAGMRINRAEVAFDQARMTTATDKTVQGFEEAAKNLRASADEIESAGDGFFGSIVNFLRGNPTGKDADILRSQAQFEDTSAARLKRVEESAGSQGQIDIAGTLDEFTASLQSFQATGATAVEQFNAIITAFDDFNAAVNHGTRVLTAPQQLKAQLAASESARGYITSGRLTDPLQAALDQQKKDQSANNRSGARVQPPPTAAMRATQELIKRYNDIDPDQFATSTERTVKKFLDSGQYDVGTGMGQEALRQALTKNYASMFLTTEDARSVATKVVADLAKGLPQKPTIQGLVALIEQAEPIATAAAQQTAVDYQYGGRATGALTSVASVQANDKVRRLKGLRDAALNANRLAGYDPARDALTPGRQPFSPARIKQLEEDVKAAENEAADASVDNMRSQFGLVQASRPSENKMARLNDTIGEINKELGKPHISPEKRVALLTEHAQTETQKRLQATLDTAAAARAKVDPRDEIGNAQATLNAAAAERRRIENEAALAGERPHGQAYSDAQRAEAEARVAADQANLESRLARRHVGTFGDDPLQSAKLAVDDARDRMNAALKGSTAYYQAQQTYIEAQRAYADKQAEYTAQMARLSTDLTNPVQQAKNELDVARATLSRDTSRGAPKATIAKDREDVYNKAAALDQTGFSQRLNDIQHANEMGKISNQAYLEYLSSERTRLKIRLAGMANTDQAYRQTVEQIQQLDSAIKSAADTLQGQFNIGDIKIPTPYQVRRAIETKTAGNIAASNSAYGLGGNVTTDNSSKSIVMNGVPIQTVLAMIQDLFGSSARSRAARRIP